MKCDKTKPIKSDGTEKHRWLLFCQIIAFKSISIRSPDRAAEGAGLGDGGGDSDLVGGKMIRRQTNTKIANVGQRKRGRREISNCDE